MSLRGKREIELRTVGGVQSKLPMYNVQSIPMLLPESKLLSTFEKQMELLNKSQNAFMKENQRLNQLKNLLLSKLTIE